MASSMALLEAMIQRDRLVLVAGMLVRVGPRLGDGWSWAPAWT